MKPIVHLTLITITTATLLQGTGYCSANEQPADALEFLESSIESKTLMLASRPEYFVSGNSKMFGKGVFFRMDMGDQKALRKFSFRIQLEQPDTATIEMLLSANKQDAAVVVQTGAGNPHRLLANDLFVMCDPKHPGGLAYFEGGSFFWGLSKGIDQANMSTDADTTSFAMEFDTIAGISTIILDAEHLIKRAVAQSTNTTCNAEQRIVVFDASESTLEIQFAGHKNATPFGIQNIKLAIHAKDANLALSLGDFKTGETAISGLHGLSLQHVKALGLPMRAIDSNEFERVGKSIVPQKGFPASPAEKEASAKLKELVESLRETPDADNASD